METKLEHTERIDRYGVAPATIERLMLGHEVEVLRYRLAPMGPPIEGPTIVIRLVPYGPPALLTALRAERDELLVEREELRERLQVLEAHLAHQEAPAVDLSP